MGINGGYLLACPDLKKKFPGPASVVSSTSYVTRFINICYNPACQKNHTDRYTKTYTAGIEKREGSHSRGEIPMSPTISISVR